MTRILCLVMLFLVASCAQVQPREFKGPNGKVAYSMRCSGMGRTLDDCYAKAGELCPAGYNIIDRASGTVAVPVSGGGFIAAPQHNLAIECK
jgi:hypothetical protein